MLNFASISSRFFLILHLLPTSLCLAQNWSIDTTLVNVPELEELKKEYKNIDDSTISSLLNAINQVRPMLELKALKNGDSYLVVGEKAKVISRIKVTGVNVVLGREILAKLNPLVKKVDNNDLRRKIIDLTYDYIRRKGYLQSSLRLEVLNPNDFNIELKVSVFLGKPCLIHGVRTYEKIDLDIIKFPIQKGEICDVQDIYQRFESYSEVMRKNGFIDYNLKIRDIRYYPKTNSSEILLEGNTGMKTSIQIINEEGKNLLLSLFSEDIIKEVNIYEMNADDIAVQIKDIYKNRGYYSAEVHGPFRKKGGNGDQVVVFRVIEGEIYYIDAIQYHGVHSFKENELSSLFDFKNFYQFRRKLKMDELENGISKLEAFYQNRGFWDVEVYQPQILIKKTGHAVVKIAVDEGKNYVFRSLNISGNHDLKKGALLEELDLHSGSILKQEQIVRLEEEIKKRFSDIGYLYASTVITLKTNEVDDTFFTDIAVDIKPGKRVKIGRVYITGLVDTKTRVVQRELLFKSGDWYDREKIEASRKFLINLSIFNSVAIKFVDRFDLAAGLDTLDLEVTLKEGLPGTVSFGPGWSQLSGTRFNIDASYLNFAGQGRQMFSRLGFSEERRQEQIREDSLIGRSLNAGYVEPWLLGIPVDGTLTFSHIAKARDFWSLDYISEASLTHRFRSLSHDTSLSLFVRNKVSKEVGTREQNILLVSSGDVRIGSYGLRLTTDRRDDKGWPTDGYFFRGQVSYADYILDSNVNYFNWEVDYRIYFKVVDDLVLALSTSYRAFNKTRRLGDLEDVLPSSERSYVGGADSVRGYTERSLGPYILDSSDSFGGSYRGIYKAELRYRFFKPFVFTLFADAGNVFFSNKEKHFLNQRLANNGVDKEVLGNFVLRPEEYLKKPNLLWDNNFTSYGVALGVTTPLGMLNVSYGIPSHAPEDLQCTTTNADCPVYIDTDKSLLKRGKVHVNFGVNF